MDKVTDSNSSVVASWGHTSELSTRCSWRQKPHILVTD